MPEYEKWLLEDQEKVRYKKSKMTMSEIMTIIIYFHQSHYRDFKTYYQRVLQGYLKDCFPKLLSYNRFVEIMKTAIYPLIFLYSISVKN